MPVHTHIELITPQGSDSDEVIHFLEEKLSGEMYPAHIAEMDWSQDGDRLRICMITEGNDEFDLTKNGLITLVHNDPHPFFLIHCVNAAVVA